jgi:hypothetical protein
VNGSPHIIGAPTYGLIQRGSLFASIVKSVPPGASAQFSNQLIPVQQLQATQVLKIISMFGALLDLGSTSFLTVRNMGIFMFANNAANSSRAWSAGYGPSIIGAGAGIIVNVTDDEYIKGNDYAEQGSATQPAFNIAADLQNTDAAAHNMTVTLSMLFELYQIETFHRGAGIQREADKLAKLGVRIR